MRWVPSGVPTPYRYTCLPQAGSASKNCLLTGKDQSRVKNGDKGWNFFDFCVKASTGSKKQSPVTAYGGKEMKLISPNRLTEM